MTTTEQQWREWHEARVRRLNSPYGWLSLVSLDWLDEGTPLRIANVPGSWVLVEGIITYVPDDGAETITVDGKPVTEATVVLDEHGQDAGQGRSSRLLAGDLRLEVLSRVDSLGEAIHGIRVRDPKESARRQLPDVPVFPFDPAWVRPARFDSAPGVPVLAPTVEHGVLETSTIVGTLTADIAGQPHEFDVSGEVGADGRVRGIVHFTDATNGHETYGAGRFIDLSADALASLTALDFNRAISFPCAVTNYVTCPLAPAGNRLDVPVTAGEKTPPVRVDRLQTYRKDAASALADAPAL
ncbi:DUF1684 domain-containing protein [Brooklawnia cerclae]|uniref:DUF1684 domain-containing protein n=1 Tax=Brooklawnia cerclae TaxID=349934 RepID=A0ABX0SGX6_9ACTN|nr:DUF1684 domain-containing protein [Brooklawnia cerclae]NIH55986.1 hypothetical protein [Brooklawnia cerclae]